MTRPIVLNPEAQHDLAEARAWYELRRQGLGDELLDGVEEILEGVSANPFLYAKVHRDLRIALVKRFPYLVVYRVDETQITVAAVYHTRRNPRGWKRRE